MQTSEPPQGAAPQPTAITLHQASRTLEITFDDGAHFAIPFELMRVLSPSAEVRGHGDGPMVVVHGKQQVQIVDVASIGHYAIQPTFDDGHASGIYTWPFLYDLGANMPSHWADYRARVANAQATSVGGDCHAYQPPSDAAPKRKAGGGCGSGGCGGGGCH